MFFPIADEVYGNVIGGNNAASIKSNFVGDFINSVSLSAGDTQWRHDVTCPKKVMERENQSKRFGFARCRQTWVSSNTFGL